MNLAIDRNDIADLNVRAALSQLDRDNRAFWLAIPEDVMAGIYEEIVELEQEGTAQQHWAWPYINWTKQMALPLH